MATFKEKLWVEYPVPFGVSIWGGDTIEEHPMENLDVLIESCMEELRSDIYVTDYVHAYSMDTPLPCDTIAIVTARLQTAFSGNTYVKVQFDKARMRAYCRYAPAILTIRRKLSMESLEMLEGEFLRFAKMYMLWKMADKELAYLKSVIVDTDNAVINTDTLRDFAERCRSDYEERKKDIYIWTAAV